MRLLRDWAVKDIEAYHRFLWSRHLGYAGLYEAVNDFGSEKLLLSRHLFFADLFSCLKERRIRPEDVRSLFEVGCSSGFLLRFAETELFPWATELAGIDIDLTAVRRGQRYLAQHGSKIQIECADMADLDSVLGERCYDVILCPGVLMYLEQGTAERVVRSAIRHARLLVAIVGLGHPETDNRVLLDSQRRDWDAALIHNVDAMVEKAGGRILARRWEGNLEVSGQRIYFVFSSGAAIPSAAKAMTASSTRRA